MRIALLILLLFSGGVCAEIVLEAPDTIPAGGEQWSAVECGGDL